MKKFFIGLALLHTISLTTQANNGRVQTDSTEHYATVKVIGEKNDQVYLQVNFHPEKAGTIEITDGLGEVLYSERIGTNRFSKMVRFSTEELPGGVEINFIEKGVIVKKYNLNVDFVKTYAIEEIAKTN